jgi:hypothetical protein
MNLAFKPDETQEYVTKTELVYMLRTTYHTISHAIRTGRLAIHLIDGKIKINLAEAKEVLPRSIRNRDLFD